MAEKVYSVKQVNLAIRKTIRERSRDLSAVWIEGEISGWKPSRSRHVYLTLKDADSQLSCVVYSWDRKCLADAAATGRSLDAGGLDGLKVRVRGELDLYMPSGQFQLHLLELKVSGAGDLYAEYEKLKQKLTAEGLFDPVRKRKLPFLPHRIGLVTSPTGAVIHDMCEVLVRRFPNLEIRNFPVKVQGEGAATEIADAVRYFNVPSDWNPELIIVARGGGSIEDLWAFNEEVVVRAVASSEIPVISAVGHETDFTLCDFAADFRAGTPSIAAETAVPVKAELVAKLTSLEARLRHAPEHAGELFSQKLENFSNRMKTQLVQSCGVAAQRIDGCSTRLTAALSRTNLVLAQRLDSLSTRLSSVTEKTFDGYSHRLDCVRNSLNLLNPYAVLDRGYSITFNSNGKVVKSVSSLHIGDVVHTRLSDGEISAQVT